MRTSVIVVGYNNQEDLMRCLPALLASLSMRDEVILVDNASSDTSVAWLEQTYPQVFLVHAPENLGFAGGNNLGARHASGKYLAFLNPDTLVDLNWLDTLVAVMESDPTAGLATSKILLLNDPERINTCGNDVHISGITLCRGMGQPRPSFPNLEEVNAVSGAAFIIRSDLFKQLGGFDERFFMYMEDTDLSWRARIAGYSCLYVPESIVYHDYTLTFGARKTYYQERNRYLMLLKSLRWRSLLALLPALLLAEVVTWGYSLLRDRKNLANKMHAYTWVVKHWDEILRDRRRVQATREVGDRQLLVSAPYRLGYEQTVDGELSWISHAFFDPGFFILRKFALIFKS